MKSSSFFVFSYQKNACLSFKIQMVISTCFTEKVLNKIFICRKIIEIFISQHIFFIHIIRHLYAFLRILTKPKLAWSFKNIIKSSILIYFKRGNITAFVNVSIINISQPIWLFFFLFVKIFIEIGNILPVIIISILI